MRINRKAVVGILIALVVIAGLFVTWRVNQKPEITPRRGVYYSTSMEKMLSSLGPPINNFELGDSFIRIETPDGAAKLDYTIERKLLGKDVIRLSRPPGTASAAEDFDGVEFEILSDEKLRSAGTYSQIDKDEVFELMVPVL